MSKFFILAMAVIAFSGCKKAVLKAEQNAVVQQITNGHWKVTSYIKGNTDVTATFAPYEFQFQTNNTVDAFRNGVIEESGSWQADIVGKTITSGFANANDTLTLLNGLWTIKDNTWTSVYATQSVNNEVRVLKLNKK